MKERVKNKSGKIVHRKTWYLSSILLVILIAAIGCGDENDDNQYDEFDDTETPDGLIIKADDFLSGKNDIKNDLNEVSYKKQTEFAPLTPNGQTVAFVELERYLGKWYEIATYEQAFQRNCTGTTATYGLNDNGTISVTNECYKDSLKGRYDIARAYARVIDEETFAKLKVYFFPLFGGDYWIIELDGTDGDRPYQFAVVGSSTKRFLWILSRTPQVSEERIEKILDRLVKRGYDLEKLSFTIQPEN